MARWHLTKRQYCIAGAVLSFFYSHLWSTECFHPRKKTLMAVL